METEEEIRSELLKSKRICRFCLTQEEPLSSIYSRESKIPTILPLTLQIMACVAIEVFSNDGMPCTICDNCRFLMDHCYRFKQLCKKADTMLKTYPITGVWPEKLDLPKDFIRPRLIPVAGGATLKRIANNPTNASPEAKKIKVINNLQITPASQSMEIAEIHLDLEPEPQTPPKIIKLTPADIKQISQQKTLNKVPAHPVAIAKKTTPPVKLPAPKAPPPTVRNSTIKIINGNPQALKKLNIAAPRILNKLSETSREKVTHMKTDDGTIVQITEDDLEEQEDPIKNATKVQTNVFPCHLCDRSFPLKQLLDIHMANHTRERNHGCDMCDKKFFSKYDLAKHTLTHTGERPFQCVVCGASFSRSTLLTRHQKIHKDQPKFVCVYCERTFLSSEELDKHTINHERERPFHCHSCPKSFAYKQGLERHEMTHKKNLPFPCEYCDHSFLTAGKLARHLTAHAGERPYPCRSCPKSFMLSHHLTRHVRSHFGTGAYRCSDCEQIFNTQDELIYHSAVHATESLTCPLCKEQFTDLDMVTEHIKSHTEGDQYACDYCDLLFTSSEKLELHCQNEHINELCMERSIEAESSGNNQHIIKTELEADSQLVDQQQYIIEEIAINPNGSQTVTTFIDGEPVKKENRQQPKVSGDKIKAEIFDDFNDDGEESDEEQEQDPDDNGFLEGEGEEDEVYEDAEHITDEVEPRSPTPSPPVPKKVVSVSKAAPAAKVEEKKASSSAQRKLDEFIKITLKKSPENKPVAVKPAAPPVEPKRNVQDVLKNLPKGVTIVKNLPKQKTADLLRTSTPQTGDGGDGAPISSSSSSSSSSSFSPAPVKENTGSNSRPPRIAKKLAEEKMAEQKSPETKKAVEVKKTPEPTKAPVVKKGEKKSPEVKKAPEKNEKPSTSTPAKPAADLKKQTKTFEMKIGDKMVKVQKVVMTKAEVAAMAKEGKIEMQGGTMILKQQGKKQK